MSVATAIALESLSFAFAADHQVLADLNLVVDKGERVGVMGPSGSGKTTLLKLIAGLRGYSPTRGTCLRSDRFAMAFQQPLLLDHLSIRDNILLPARIANKPCEIEDVVHIMGLEHLLSRYPYQISGGQQRRVALARALLSPGTRGLLMDEPFTGLDEPLRERILVEVEAALNALSLTCVFATHSPFEAAFLADRIVFLGNTPATIASIRTVTIARGKRHELLEEREFFEEVAAIRRTASATDQYS